METLSVLLFLLLIARSAARIKRQGRGCGFRDSPPLAGGHLL